MESTMKNASFLDTVKTVLSGFSGLHMISSDPSGVEPAKNVVVLGSGALPHNDYAGGAELDLVTQLRLRGVQGDPQLQRRTLRPTLGAAGTLDIQRGRQRI